MDMQIKFNLIVNKVSVGLNYFSHHEVVILEQMQKCMRESVKKNYLIVKATAMNFMDISQAESHSLKKVKKGTDYSCIRLQRHTTL